MEAVFLKFVNMSITASWLVLAIIAVRIVFRKTPKWILCLLWGLVAVRLICPISIESSLSLIPNAEPLSQEMIYADQPEKQARGDILDSSGNVILEKIPPVTRGEILDSSENVVLEKNMTSTAGDSAAPIQVWSVVVSRIWIIGIAVMLLYTIISYYLLKHKVATAIPIGKRIKQSEFVESPFVLGIVRPVIYLPFGMEETDLAYVLAHENAHIRRRDHWWKPIGFLLLSVYWFNPVLWVAYILLCRDIEAACDEKVIKDMEKDDRRAYSTALLNCSIHRRRIAACPLAFGEAGVKSRVKSVMNYKKPAFWVVLFAVIVILVLAACFMTDPQEEKSIEELTRQTVNEPVGFGVGDLYFTYPAGLTSEQREVENWTKEDALRLLRGEPNRNQWNTVLSDRGTVFGGVVDFIVPENREISLTEMTLPAEWMGLDYISSSSAYPCVDTEYTLVKDGRDYIQLYLYTYSGRGYFLWFYVEQGEPADKQAILESVELGNGSRIRTKLERDEEISLGLFNLTIPKGYGYYRNETVYLEISKQNWGREDMVVGGVIARPNPNVLTETSGDLVYWVEAMGIHLNAEGLSYDISDETEFGDIFLSFDDASQGKPVIEERHYFFIAGDIVYDLWFDELHMDSKTEKAILESVWLKESNTVPAANKWVTAAGETTVQIGQLPVGYNYGFDKDQNIVFAWGNNAVGGIRTYPISEDIYDPYDKTFFWLEEMGIPDFEDTNLIYLGGITSGDNGWAAEFADNLTDEAQRTVYRRHTFQVVGDTLYDIWFDMLNISWDSMMEIRSAVQLPQVPTAEVKEKTAEDIAYEKTKAVMDLVSEGSCHIISQQENKGNEGPRGYERTFLYHEDDFLFTNRVLTEGKNITEAGEYYNRYALLIVNDEWFSNEGHQGTAGDIVWSDAEPTEPTAPWLGNRAWNKTFATYMDTLTDTAGTCYMFRYDYPYEDRADYDKHYFVNFYFDSDGNFLNVKLQVNLFRDNEFTVTESIVSLDPETVNAEIQKEYQQAIG